MCNIWHQAVQTNRHLDWDREALYDHIIERLPFWIEPWSTYRSKRPHKVITFKEFEAFLEQCVRALRHSNKLRLNGNRRDTNARVGATAWPMNSSSMPFESPSSPLPASTSYAAVAAQVASPTETRRPPSGQSRGPSRNAFGPRQEIRCYKCQGPHYLEICPEFQALPGEEMRDFLARAGRCRVCSRYHPNRECLKPNVRCWICQGNHVAGIHKAAILDIPAVDIAAEEAPDDHAEA